MVRKAARVNQGDLLAERAGVHGSSPEEPEPTGVRAPVVAMKLRNGSGAKGAQEGGYVKTRPMEARPTPVSRAIGTKQVGEVQARWAWTEPAVWTERMLTALEEGVKGDIWFSLIDKVYQPGNLRAAFTKVKANQGAAGVDHQTIEMFEANLDTNLSKVSQQLADGSYRPQAVRRKWIAKPGSSEQRPLGIPTVRDRVVETALRNVLEPIFERDFAEHSYGFRPRRGCKDALRRVDHLLKAGDTWVVDADLQSYFDTIPKQKLMEQVAKKVADSRVMELVEAMLQQEVMEGLAHWTPEAGTPQGAVISPLLSNIYLDPLDHEVAGSGYEMVRYADDFVILCRSEAEARAALAKVQQWTAQAGLRLHPEKTRIVDATQRGGFDFLGYHFERGYRWPRPKSVAKLKATIRNKTRRTQGHSLRTTIETVNQTLTGWFGYFKHSHKTAFPTLDKWIRMRLRTILRQRLKRKGRARGTDNVRWPNAFFAAQGLLSLSAARVQCGQPSRR
jgi:RNA-directed DNA polymerase